MPPRTGYGSYGYSVYSKLQQPPAVPAEGTARKDILRNAMDNLRKQLSEEHNAGVEQPNGSEVFGPHSMED